MKISIINQFLNQFDVELALKNLLGSKGKVVSGKQYIDLIQSEFKIRNFEIWLSKVKDKMIESANHWKEDRNYNITSSYYGKPLVREPKLCYKENEVLNIIETIVEETIKYIAEQFTNLSYDQEKCERDVRLITEAVAYDTVLGTNYNSITAGLAYARASADVYNTTSSTTGSQTTVTVAAYNYLKGLTLALSDVAADSTATTRVTEAWDEVIDIITGRAYNSDTCRRDVGLIVDALISDLDENPFKAVIYENREYRYNPYI